MTGFDEPSPQLVPSVLRSWRRLKASQFRFSLQESELRDRLWTSFALLQSNGLSGNYPLSRITVDPSIDNRRLRKDPNGQRDAGL
jgi:hypothetical protein